MKGRALAFGLALTTRVAADPPAPRLSERIPPRPFLVLSAPQRFPPGEPAFVLLRSGTDVPLSLALYRIRDPAPFIARRLGAEGVSIANDLSGADAEDLLQRTEALPRRGALLDLLFVRRLPLPRRPRWTYDGRAERLALGELPSGLYLARVYAGGWAASVVVSSGALTELVRRGDARDVVLVTDDDGRSQGDVSVSRLVEGAAPEVTRTSADGEAGFSASEAAEARYVATRGDDVTWADATWARGDVCDVRTYVATGQPQYRAGDSVVVRGHVRGCVDGGDAPLRGEPVTLRAGDAWTDVRTDGDGNILAALPAAATIVATVRGHDHVRTLAIDDHPRPLAPLRMRFDRDRANPRDEVMVTVSDDHGGFPAEGVVRLAGEGVDAHEVSIGPGSPATFRVRVPDLPAAQAQMQLRATVTPLGPSVWVDGALWIGTPPDEPEGASPHAATSEPMLAARTPPPSAPERAFEVRPAVPRTDAGGVVPVILRAPSLGATWLTLERRGVWWSRLTRADDEVPLTLDVPTGLRGAATVVATHVRRGAVTTTSAPLGVATPRTFTLSVRSDRRAYAGATTAHITLDAHTTEGVGRDAVVTLWVSDAGWWDDEEDTQPSPDAWFRLPTERAGAGDSARPLSFGSEEGRRYAPVLRWNDQPLPRSTFRHMWASASEAVTFEAMGEFGAVATRLATTAGFARAAVCAAAARRAGAVRLEVREVPWDIAARRVAERTGTVTSAVGDTLRFDCPTTEGTIGMGNIGTMGHGSGSGSGQGYGPGRRLAHSREATRLVLGLRRLGAAGRAMVDVPLPDIPGRWRVEALAIADDGAGARAHAEFTTR